MTIWGRAQKALGPGKNWIVSLDFEYKKDPPSRRARNAQQSVQSATTKGLGW